MKNKTLHQKIAMLLLLIIAGTSGIVQAEAEQANSKITARWNCFKITYPEPNEPIVIAEVGGVGDSKLGIIEANGITKRAHYQEEGLTHRWDFDFNEDDGGYDASFIIKPDGTGLYYYFGTDTTAKLSLITECTKTQ